MRNFLLSGLVAGIGLSPWTGRFLFAAGNTAGNTAGAGYLLFMLLVATAAVNLASGPSIAETAYADYGLTRVPSTRVATDLTDPLRVFLVNNQWASILDGGDPPRPTPYVQRIQRLLVDDLGLRGGADDAKLSQSDSMK